MRFRGTTQWTPPPETRWDTSWSYYPSVADVGVVRYLPVACFTFGEEKAEESRIARAFSAFWWKVPNTVAAADAGREVQDTVSSLFPRRSLKSKNINASDWLLGFGSRWGLRVCFCCAWSGA